ncbi:serine/threonine-protein phosphatase 6 regulatory ankyrin repeat subunit A-like [Argiope bruennichi]|uniref:serine/threonine-protein phosphatase 6 regulatory ankyrin repeat subunit A-like n=1 Tax=Argiope bruennichi TaxID=94029 RepID=UPI00249445F8|nr:serine/threonine-protein phosphatase 6 regulatory ankyrin repeat subunit A-like [Argiope bruennichi]
MEMLLKCNAGLDRQDILGNSAMHYAIDNCYMLQRKIYNYESPGDGSHTDLEAVKLLIKYHPNINICNSLSETPLIWAVKKQNLQTVQILIEGGAIHSLSDYCDNGPLHYSLDRTEINVLIVTELLRHGSNHLSENNRRETPVDVYLKRLRNASPSEHVKAKYLFKLFVFRKNYFKNTQCREIADISRKTKSSLCQFFWYCRFEIEQMKSAEVATGFSVYYLASRVFYYGISEEIPPSLDIFDIVLEKLKGPEYTIYIDMIVSGICREYLAVKTAETGYWVDRNDELVEFLNFATPNDFTTLRDLLRAGVNPNTADERGKTPLHIAVCKKEENIQEFEPNLQVVRELIYFGADVNRTDNLGNTPLHFAVCFRNYKMMEILLKCSAGIDIQNRQGNTAMHYAIDNCKLLHWAIPNYKCPGDRKHTDLEAVKLLMNYHADINLSNSLSETPLIWAVKVPNLQIVQALLEGGALHSLSDFLGNGPLHYSLDRTQIYTKIVNELLRYGSNHASKNKRSQSPVDVCLKRLHNASPTEQEKAAYLLKLFVFRKNTFKSTQSNDFEILRDLLRTGINPNTADARGNTPLDIAVWKKEENIQECEANLQFVRELIHFGANVNHTDDSRNTALHFAVGFRKYKTMEILLKCNAGLDRQGILENSAMHYAIDNFYMLQRKIYNYESPRDQPHTDLEAIKLLMKYHPNRICPYQWSLSETPLIWAVKKQNLQTVQILIEGGAIHSLSDYCDNRPLHYSLDRTEINVSIVTELLRHGSSHASKNNRLESPIDLYLKRLRNASPSEHVKAKYLFKLFVFRKNYFKNTQCREIADISRKTKSSLCQFFWYCRFEIEQMKSAEVATGFSVYYLASRVFYYSISEEIPPSFDIFDIVLEKLKRPEYTIYIDMIVSGICREYLAVKTAETGYWVDRNGSSFFKICRICNMLYENASL